MTELSCPCCGSDIPDDGRVRFDEAGFVIAGGRMARLTEREIEIFLLLFNARPRMVSRQAIFENTYWLHHEDEAPSIKVIDVYICTIRAKLRPLGLVIETIWGRGYRMPAGKAAA